MPPHKGIKTVAASAANVEQLSAVCSGAERVFCCIGVEYTRWLEEWPPIFEGVLAACKSSGAALVWFDNMYCYGPQSEPLKETTKLTKYGRKPALRAGLVARLEEYSSNGGTMVRRPQ